MRPSLADPVGYARVNVTGTAAVVEAARQAGVSRFVFGSSSSVYGDSTPVPFREDAVAIDPVSPYAATKRAGELFLSSVAPIYGFRAASLRFFTVYGPRQRPDLAIHAFTRKMVEGRTLTLFGDGTQSRDYTYCDDIIAGVLAAVDVDRKRSGGGRDLQPRRQPVGRHRGHGGRDRCGAGGQAQDRVGARCSRAMYSGPRPISPNPVRCWGTRPRRRFRRVFAVSFNGIGRHMAGQTELLLARARERFVVQDYYGAVHLLESVVDSGRAFADVHHLLGVSLSLLGQGRARAGRAGPGAGAEPAVRRGVDSSGTGPE